MAQTPEQFVRRRLQINHFAAFTKMFAVRRAQHRATTRGENAFLVQRQFIDHRLFNIAKVLLAFPLKVFANGTTQTSFDLVVGVNTGELEPPGELAPDGGLA